MKVVINTAFGGFGLSTRAIEECIKRGMTVTRWVTRVVDPDSGVQREEHEDPTADFVDNKTMDEDGGWLGRDRYVSTVGEYSVRGRDRLEFRTNPVLISVVEELGSKEASGQYAKLKVVDIPFESFEGWEIEEYDGKEEITETHRVWS